MMLVTMLRMMMMAVAVKGGNMKGRALDASLGSIGIQAFVTTGGGLEFMMGGTL